MNKRRLLLFTAILALLITSCGTTTSSKDTSQNSSEGESSSKSNQSNNNPVAEMNIGDTATSEDWSITLTNSYTSDILESSESDMYFDANDGVAFCVLEFDVTCLNSTQPTIDDQGITNPVATVNGNTYKDWTYQYIANGVWSTINHTYLDANLPLHIYVYTNIPSANMNDKIIVNTKVAGEDKTISIN